LFERIAVPRITTGAPTPLPPPDKTPPTFTVAVTRAKLAAALRHGLQVHIDCNENCSVRLRLVLSARRARALGMKVRGNKSVLLAEGSYGFPDRRTSDIVLRFSRRTRKALARAKLLPLKLTTIASDLTGNDAVHVQTVTLRR
jgi:hypothetical protein